MTRFAIALALLALALPAIAADDKGDILATQKAAAAANWKKVDLGEATVIETDALIVYGTFPAKVLKPLADAVTKHHAVAATALRYTDEEKPWPGKLTLYVFAERPDFASFLRRIEARSPERDENGSNRPTGDTPHAAVFVTPDAKTGYLPVSPVTVEVASALIRRKGGSSVLVPGWFQEGFGRAVIRRANAPTASRKIGDAKWAGVVNGRAAKEIWGDKLNDDEFEAFTAQFADYWAFGPGAETFPEFINALKPGERGRPPSIPMALEAAKQPIDTFEKAWKKYNGK